MSKTAPVKLSKKHKEILPNTGYAKWIDKMKKFTQSRKEVCKAYPKERDVHTVQKILPSGSKYEGTWDMFTMTGFGQFIFPPDYGDGGVKFSVLYDGAFDEGEFHGDGVYTYENGISVRGKFEKGIMKERKVFFANGLEYTHEDWGYCQMPDRRFASECKGDLKSGGESQMTADLPTIKITSPDIYDTTDGLYDKHQGCIYNYGSRCSIRRLPNSLEGHWIEKNCRNGYDGPIGPSRRLYENWQDITLELPPMPEATQFDDEEEFDEDPGGWRRSRRSTIGSKFKRRFSYKSTAITFGD